jgi:hypothetical protein
MVGVIGFEEDYDKVVTDSFWNVFFPKIDQCGLYLGDPPD